uniref:DZF domain-containing protein n=1 Tax=Romanomermis culicivorax TaxID=13658 RepID=A0A915I2N2_ROMCU
MNFLNFKQNCKIKRKVLKFFYRGRGGMGMYGPRGPPGPFMNARRHFGPMRSPMGMERQGLAAPVAAPPRPPFDLALCEPMFPRVKEFDDSLLNQALLKRNTELTPTAAEQTTIMNLITKVANAIEKLIVSPDSFTSATIDEVKQVGSFKKGTMLTKRNVADLTVVMKTLPTKEAVAALGNKIILDLKEMEPREPFVFSPKDYGGDITGHNANVRLLVTTIPSNMKNLEPELHLSLKNAHINMAAIRHARYLEEQASHSSIKVLVRLLKDIRSRFFHLQPLNVWMIELLAYYAIMNTPNHQPLPLNQAFRRCFQLLAAGIFLPGSAGIMDPCEIDGARVQNYMTLEEQDTVCCIAQTLLRVLCHGGYKAVLGLEKAGMNISTEMSVWGGVVITPSDKAYDAALLQQEAKSGSVMQPAAIPSLVAGMV